MIKDLLFTVAFVMVPIVMIVPLVKAGNRVKSAERIECSSKSSPAYESESVDTLSYAEALEMYGLSRGYSQSDVRSTYRTLAKVHHPDNTGNYSLTSKYKFIRVVKAKEILEENCRHT